MDKELEKRYEPNPPRQSPECASRVLYDEVGRNPRLPHSEYHGRIVFVVNGRRFQCKWKCDMRQARNVTKFTLEVFYHDGPGWVAILDGFRAEVSVTDYTRLKLYEWIDYHMPLAIRILDGD